MENVENSIKERTIVQMPPTLNGKKTSDFEKKRALILAQKEEADRSLQQLEIDEKKAKIDEELNNKARKKALLEEANEYERMANEAGLSKGDVDNRLQWAKAARKEAEKIVTEDDKTAAPEIVEDIQSISVTERLLGWLSTHGLSWALQIVFLAGIAYFCYDKTMSEMKHIQTINAEMQAQGRVAEMLTPPVDYKDIQQMYFDKLQLITDVGFGLFILLVMAPHILITIIPFIKEPKYLWKPFFILPERDKQWLAFAWSALVLLVTIYSHPHR